MDRRLLKLLLHAAMMGYLAAPTFAAESTVPTLEVTIDAAISKSPYDFVAAVVEISRTCDRSEDPICAEPAQVRKLILQRHIETPPTKVGAPVYIFADDLPAQRLSGARWLVLLIPVYSHEAFSGYHASVAMENPTSATLTDFRETLKRVLRRRGV